MHLFFALILLLWTPLAWAQSPQDLQAFEQIDACQKLIQGVQQAEAIALRLTDVLSQNSNDAQGLDLKLSQGSQVLLAYGEKLFESTQAHEALCIQSLIDQGHAPAILVYYKALLPSMVQSYAFFQSLEAQAQALGKQKMLKTLSEVKEGYLNGLKKVVQQCQDHLGHKHPGCLDFQAQLNQALFHHSTSQRP